MKMRKLTAFAAAAAMLMSCPIPSAQAEDQVFMHDTFESGTDSWTGRGAASAAASSDFSCEGSSSLSVTGRTAAWNGAIKELSSDFVAGQSYSFSANVMYTTGGASDTFYMKLEYKNSEGVVSYSEIAAGETVKDAWVQLSNQSYTIPEGATDLKVYVETADSQNSFYLDDFGAGSEGTVFKGTGPSKKLQRGDIDYDGRISVFDIILGRQLLTGEYDNAAALKAADADGNKTYEVNDLVLINEFVQGKISEFPEPPKPDNPWDEYVETASDQYISFYKDAICNMGNTQRLVKKLEAAENGESW